ncbi:MAG: TonB-dependent receptor [Opitutus sp.]
MHAFPFSCRAHAHLVVLTFLACCATASRAQTAAGSAPPETIQLDRFIVEGRETDLVGVATSASEGHVGQAQLRTRPVIRPGEILETVPGLIVSQHSGEGKANQYYLRGFNLDHGTDFATTVEGVPVNLVSHAHGQGWSDTAFLMPELVKTITYQKGVYYAQNGDFSSAGAADVSYVNELPGSLAKVEVGSFNYYRGFFAGSSPTSRGRLLYAVEGVHSDGPFKRGDDYRKGNGVLRYSEGNADSGWSATVMGYKAKWNATDQIPLRGVTAGVIDRFGLIDPSDGGDSQRYSLTAEWHRRNSAGSTRVMAYGFFYEMDLFSNFTYFLADPVRGDQFEQTDKRFVSGLKASHAFFHRVGEAAAESTVGLQVRNDSIRNGLFSTEDRRSYAVVREDDVTETSVSPYAENRVRWNDWLRTTVGARADTFRFAVGKSNQAANAGSRTATLVSPKGGIVLGPWAGTEVYANGGLGFHSNDARGVNTRADPVTGLGVDAAGDPIRPAAPLVRTVGAEAGVRTTWIKGLQSTLTFWLLDIDSELLFTGDAGTTEASRPSRRYGGEFANYYAPTKWLSFDVDLSVSKSRFRDNELDPMTGAPIGRNVPGSVESVVAAGVNVHDLKGFSGGLRLRYFGPRPLIEDDSVRSKETLLLTALAGYEFGNAWEVQVELFNLLNRKDSAIDYYYTSRLPGEPPEGIADKHFHPAEPRSLRVSVTRRF